MTKQRPDSHELLARTQAEEAQLARAKSNNGPLLLHIEDENRIQYFLRVALMNNGYRLIEATTAQEGLVQAAMNPPDLGIAIK